MAKLTFYGYGDHNNMFGVFHGKKSPKITLNISFDKGEADIMKIKKENYISTSEINKLIRLLDEHDFKPSKNIIRLLNEK